MGKNISLNIDHPNSRRMEFFLNSVDAELVEIPFDWKTLLLSDRISGGRKFKSTDDNTPIIITVLLCDSYHDANEIAKLNDFPSKPTARWSLNGGLLYVVESEDEETVGEILSLFAGKE